MTDYRSAVYAGNGGDCACPRSGHHGAPAERRWILTGASPKRAMWSIMWNSGKCLPELSTCAWNGVDD